MGARQSIEAQDRICFPGQAGPALEKFPDAKLYWLDRCGHFPQWDRPKETARLILDVTGEHEPPPAWRAAAS